MEINERVNEGMANQFNQSLHFAETKANEERLNEEPAQCKRAPEFVSLLQFQLKLLNEWGIL